MENEGGCHLWFLDIIFWFPDKADISKELVVHKI